MSFLLHIIIRFCGLNVAQWTLQINWEQSQLAMVYVLFGLYAILGLTTDFPGQSININIDWKNNKSPLTWVLHLISFIVSFELNPFAICLINKIESEACGFAYTFSYWYPILSYVNILCFHSRNINFEQGHNDASNSMYATVFSSATNHQWDWNGQVYLLSFTSIDPVPLSFSFFIPATGSYRHMFWFWQMVWFVCTLCIFLN